MASPGTDGSNRVKTSEAEVEPQIDFAKLLCFFQNQISSGERCENAPSILGGGFSISHHHHDELDPVLGVQIPPGYKGAAVRLEETIRQIENDISNGYESGSDQSFSLDDLDDRRKVGRYLGSEHGVLTLPNKTKKIRIRISETVNNYENKIQTRSKTKAEDLIVLELPPKRKRRRSSVDKTVLHRTKHKSEDPSSQSPIRKRRRSSVDKTVLHRTKHKSGDPSSQSPIRKRRRSSVDKTALHRTKHKSGDPSSQSPKQTRTKSSADQTVRSDISAVDDTVASFNEITDLQRKQKVFRRFAFSEWAENKNQFTHVSTKRGTDLVHIAPLEADCLYIQQPIRLSELTAQATQPRKIYRPSFALDNIIFG